MSAEQGNLVKLRNVIGETLRFGCGTERKRVGEMRGLEGDTEVRRPIFHTAERMHVVPPKGIVELEEGYTLPRGGIKERPSFLVEAGLAGKLVPVEEKGA